MATIRDVARAAGVSVTTVSAAINESAPVSAALKARVMEAIRLVGYTPNPVARNLRLGHSNLIGLSVPDIASPYAASIAKSLQIALSDKGYSMFFASNGDNYARELADVARMVEHQVAGLAVLPTCLGPDYTENLVARINCPSVFMDRIVPGAPYDCVADDNHLGARLIVTHLLQLGHRAIAMIAGRIGISSSDERLQGVSNALAQAGHPLAPEFTRTHHQTEEHGFRAVQDLMARSNRPSAIITINAAQTRGAVKALRSMQFACPRDVSLISFDGFHFSSGFEPEITSLEQDIAGIGEATSAMLVERLARARNPQAGADEIPPRLLRLAPKLIVRSSCRAV